MFIFSAVPFELTKGKGSKLSHFLVINLSSVPMGKAYDLWFSSVATYLFILLYLVCNMVHINWLKRIQQSSKLYVRQQAIVFLL